MESKRFVYLAGLLPVVICSLLLFFWLLTASPWLPGPGLLLAAISLLMALSGCYHAFRYFAEPADRDRRQLPGQIFVLSLGLAISFQSLQVFCQSVMASGPDSGLMVTVKNTSTQAAKDLEIQVGGVYRLLKEIPARGETTLRLNLAYETTLKARLGNAELAPMATVAVGPNDRHVLLRLDAQLNLLPEVQ